MTQQTQGQGGGGQTQHAQHAGLHTHLHSDVCGHESRKHGDHDDFEHDGHWHAKHGDHYDDHEVDRDIDMAGQGSSIGIP